MGCEPGVDAGGAEEVRAGFGCGEVRKADAAGCCRWAVHFGKEGVGGDFGHGLDLAAGGGVVCCWVLYGE